MENNKQDYKETWNTFWVNICLNKDGSLNLDAIQRELHDYSVLMHNASIVYDHVTGGRLSKPNHKSENIIAEADDYLRRLVEECVEEEIEEYKNNH
jgi:hypothetical protein